MFRTDNRSMISLKWKKLFTLPTSLCQLHSVFNMYIMYSSCHIILPLTGHTALKPIHKLVSWGPNAAAGWSPSPPPPCSCHHHTPLHWLDRAGQWWGLDAALFNCPHVLCFTDHSAGGRGNSGQRSICTDIVLTWYYGATATSLQQQNKDCFTLTFQFCLNRNITNRGVLCVGTFSVSVQFQPKLAKCPCPCLCQCGRECQLAKFPRSLTH